MLLKWRVYDEKDKSFTDFNRRESALEFLMGELLKEFTQEEAQSILKTVRINNTNGRFSITAIDVS